MQKIVILLVVAVAVGFGGWALVLTSGVFDISLEELRAKYETPSSQYIEIDGVEIH